MNPVDLSIGIGRTLLIFSIVLASIPFLIWMERWIAATVGGDKKSGEAWILDVGLGGFLYTIVDFVRLFVSAGFAKGDARRSIYGFAGIMAFTLTLLSVAPIPFAESVNIDGHELAIEIANMRIGLIYSIAMIFICTHSLFLARIGDATSGFVNDPFNITSRALGYFAAVAFSLVSILIFSGTSNLGEIVRAQGVLPWNWFFIRQPIPFIVFCIAMFSIDPGAATSHDDETSDLAMLSMSEYARFFVWAMLTVTVFCGGWQVPFVTHDTMLLYAKQIFTVGCPVIGFVMVFCGAQIVDRHKSLYEDFRDIEPILIGMPLALCGAFFLILSMWFNYFELPEWIIEVFLLFLHLLALLIKVSLMCFIMTFVRWRYRERLVARRNLLGWRFALGGSIVSILITMFFLQVL